MRPGGVLRALATASSVLLLTLAGVACGADQDRLEADAPATAPPAPPLTTSQSPTDHVTSLPRPSFPPESGTPAPPMPGEPTPGERDFGAYLGYVGPWFARPTDGGKPSIISDSIYFSKSGQWAASGMLRNEGTRHLANVTVEAMLHLVGAKAEVIPVLATVPIEPLRPGEPAPFYLSFDVPVEVVRSVTWSVSAATVADELTDTRRLELETFWTRPYGDGPRHDGYPLTDRIEPPYPYVLFGGLQSRAQSAFSEVVVWLAFIDDQERVRFVERAHIVGPTNGDTVKPGSARDFLFVENDELTGENLNDLRVAFWAVAA